MKMKQKKDTRSDSKNEYPSGSPESLQNFGKELSKNFINLRSRKFINICSKKSHVHGRSQNGKLLGVLNTSYRGLRGKREGNISDINSEDLHVNEEKTNGEHSKLHQPPPHKTCQLNLHDIEKKLEEVDLSNIPNNDIQRLSNLKIVLPFKIPDSHLIETRLSHAANKKQLQAFAKCGIKIKKGRFKPWEDEVIRNNWKKFSDEFGFDDPGLFILLSYNGKTFIKYSERLKFVQYIANELPDRFLCSVYRRFKTLFARRATSGRYSRYNVDVDELILKSVSKGWKDPFAKLAAVTGRDRHSLCYRYRQLLTNKDYQGPKRVQWTHQLAEKIVQSLIEVCEIQDDDELRTKCITWNIWLLCSLQCGIRPKPMKLFWLSKLYTQIFATRPIYRKAVVKDLIERLLASGAKYWQDIIWRKIATDFYGCTPLFLLRILMLYKEHVPKTKWRSARATAKFIQQNMDKIKVKDARLQRYRIEEDGKLVLVDDEVGNY